MGFQLRDYQARCVEKTMAAMRLDGNDLIALPTGAGKSIIVAEIASRMNEPMLIFQPSREILEQNRSKLQKYVSVYDIGTYSASMSEKTIRKFTFATIGSVYKRPDMFAHIGLILIDEAHLVNSKNDDSMFMTFLNEVNRIRATENLPKIKIIGLTATPWRNVLGYHSVNGNLMRQVTCKLMTRTNSGPKGKQPPFWKRLIFNIHNADLVVDGYLSPLMYDDCSFITQDDIPVNASRSDFNLKVFVDKLEVRLDVVLARIAQAEKECKSILVFCSSVAQARDMARLVPGSSWVSGETPTKERTGIIEAFKHGGIQTVFNVGVLTTGFDHPELDCIVMLRPTKSLSLYYQMAGRGVRIADGKTFCTLVDFSSNVANMGAIETIKLVKEPEEGKQFPMWQLKTSTGNWHNRPLYEYQIKEKKPRRGDLGRQWLMQMEAKERSNW